MVRDVKQFILQNVESHPADIVTHAAREFGITRPAAHRHLVKLIESGLVANSSLIAKQPAYILKARQTPVLAQPAKSAFVFDTANTQVVVEARVPVAEFAPIVAQSIADDDAPQQPDGENWGED